MKVEVKVNDSLTVHAEAETAKEVFRQIAAAQETFEDSKCGYCGNKNLRYLVRKKEDNEFFELQCTDPKCRAKLAFGFGKKEGNMYPKRFETDNKGKTIKGENDKGIVKGKWGWHKWEPDHTTEEL